MSQPAGLAATRRDNRVSMVFSRETNFLRIEPDAYRFRPSGLWAPLQRACWWVLSQTSALRRHSVEDVYYTRVDIDGDRALDRIFKAREWLFRSNRRPERVLIGAEDMAEMMKDPNFNDMQRYGAGASFTGTLYQGSPSGVSAFGVPVEVIPHMRGVLVL